MTKQSSSNFSNQGDYPLLREFLVQLLRENPYSRYDVHAVGVGSKVVNGEPTNQLSIRFHVAYKIPPSRLSPERRIPEEFQFISHKENNKVTLLTDVIESPPGKPHQVDPESVVRPVPGGVSCSGHGDTWPGVGTMGGWVWDNTDDTIVMLSNQHVFGNTSGTPIIQPGSQDGGIFPQDRIGEVKRSIPLKPAPQPLNQATYPADCNFVDAAIGEADDSELFDLTVLEIGPGVYEIGNPFIGMNVEKFGQTTGHTIGQITDFPYHPLVPFPVEGQVIMCDCFRFATNDPSQLPLSSGGDSGSLVFQQGDSGVIKPVVGLLFGGGTSANNNWSMACLITNVFSELDLGPLCIAGCQAWLDALYADEADTDSFSATADTRSTPDISPVVFTLRERQRRRSRSFHTGLTLDLQKRLLTSMRGRSLISFINRHRSELLTLLVKDGDTRRAMVAALRPIFVGAITTSDVLERKLTEQDIKRLDNLAAVGARKGSDLFCESLKVLHALFDGAVNRSLAEILRIKE